MSLTDENSTAEGRSGFFSSPASPLGEETKDGGDGNGVSQSNGAESFSFKTPSGTKIEIQTLYDVLNGVPEERQWTVDGILPDSGLGVLGGRHKRGKSTLVMHLSRSVEAGTPFLERTTRQAPVVYVNYEMPLDYFASLSKAEPVPKHFYVIDRPEPKLKMETVAAVIAEMGKRGFPKGLMVIDSFRGAYKLKAEQENQSGEAGTILRCLQEIGVKAGWLIVVIHHHKKNADAEGADNLSGTSDFGAAPDVIWTWSRPADHLQPGVLEIEGRIPPVEPVVVRLSPEECVHLGTKQQNREEDAKKRIEQALGTKRMQADEIATKTDIPYGTVKKRLDSMKAEGRVDSVPGTGRGSPDLWFRLPAESPIAKPLAPTTKMEN
jgi:AAA domain